MGDEPSEVKEFLARARAAAAPGTARAAVAVLSLDELRARRGLPAEPAPPVPRLTRAQLAGRLVELSGRGAVATLTAAVGVVLEAQGEGDPVAWIGLPDATFYPPDLADSGVDLDALVVVRAPGVEAAGRAADRLLRSGGFGLVVIDLGPGGRDAALPLALQGRLVSLAQRHDAALLVVTDKPADAPSLGSIVSLRAEATRRRDGDRLAVAVRALKDKRRGPGWEHAEPVRGPDGFGGPDGRGGR